MSERPSDGYVVAGARPWSRRVFDEDLAGLPGRWAFVAQPGELTHAFVEGLKPRYLFFLHWSWKVPDWLVDGYECVCFHMTDVPYGRGGSPLQNLIVRGHQHTKLTALRMVRELDAGPVYLKQELCLAGSAEEIFLRAARQSAEMVKAILRDRPRPLPQTGEPVVFRRRTPAESAIGDAGSLPALHDFIRMLDADGYPRAFLIHGGFRYEFSRAVLYNNGIVADVTVTRVEKEPDESTGDRGTPGR